MKIIQELAKSVGKKDIAYIPTLLGLKSSSNVMKLFQGLSKDQFASDRSAVEQLYGYSSANKSKYSKLKYSTKQRLYNTILLLDIKSENGTSERKKAYFKCSRAVLISQFLILLQARKSSIELLEQYLDEMLKYEFTVLALESCKRLRQHFAIMEGDSERTRYYNQLVKDLLLIYTLETNVEGNYHILISHYVQNKSSKSFVYDLANEYYQEIATALPSDLSSTLIYKSQMMLIIKHLSVYEYKEAARFCAETIQLLKQKEYIDQTGLAIVYYQWIICCIQLTQFETAKKLAHEAINQTPAGSFNWFKGMEVLIQLYFKTYDFNQALCCHKKVVTNSNFNKLTPLLKEEWAIYEGYLQLLVAGNYLEQSQSHLQIIRPQKFLNDFPIFSKDKEGMNIPIAICYLCFLILLSKKDELIDKEEAFQKYISRYLKEEKDKRAYYFFKLLLLVPKYKFDVEIIKKKSIPILEAMKESPSTQFKVNHIFEVIPYEFLWSAITEKLLEHNSQATTLSN